MSETINTVINKADGWTLVTVDGDRFITASKSIEVCRSVSQPSELVVGHHVKSSGWYNHTHVDGENLYIRGDAWVSLTQGLYASIIYSGDYPDSLRWVWTLNGMSYGVIPVADVVIGSIINLEIETPHGPLTANTSIMWCESGILSFVTYPKTEHWHLVGALWRLTVCLLALAFLSRLTGHGMSLS